MSDFSSRVRRCVGTLRALLALGLLLASPAALAVPCGTLGSPTACTIEVGGAVTYALSNFDFVNSTSNASGNRYVAEDIAVDVSAVGTSGLAVTFSKVGPTPGIVFFANAGELSSLFFTYDLAASSLTLGTPTFSSTTTSLVASALDNGFSSVQQIVAEMGGAGVSCLAIAVVRPSETCALEAASPVRVGNFVNLSGNTGNTSILNFKHIFDVGFDSPPPTTVPEPGTLWLFTAAVGALLLVRRRQASAEKRAP